MNEINANGLPDLTKLEAAVKDAIDKVTFKPKRFPGVASFEDDDLANELFFGREEESQKVLHYVLAEHLVVIFSYSGYGKTSLLKASIFKKLREKNYNPILIRFNKKEYNPQQLIRFEMDSLNDDEKLEVLHKPGTDEVVPADNLEHYFKDLEIWSADDKLLVPVIVFDQFEEIFTLEHNQQYISSFFEELAGLLQSTKEGAVNVKMVISIREDFLGHLERMATNIPSVFSNRFRLEPLKKEQAAKAIIEPARKTIAGIEFATKSFSFSKAAVDELKDFLSLKTIEGSRKPSDDIEPIQLQIICSELENKIMRGEITPAPNQEIEIQPADFGGQEGLQKIVDNFYEQQIAHVKQALKLSASEVDAVKELIETGLIAGIRRVPLAYDAVKNMPGVNKKAIELLITNKLLKLESHRGNFLLELSHDTLVSPVLKSGARTRAEKERRRRRDRNTRFSLGIFAVLAVGGYFIYTTVSSKQASQDKYYYAALMASRQNPTLGFKIALDGEKIGSTTSKLESLLQQFRKGNYAFITNSLNFHGTVSFAYLSKNKQEINVYGMGKKEIWDMNGNLKLDSLYRESTFAACRINGNYFTLASSVSGDEALSIYLIDEKNTVVKTINLKKKGNSDDIKTFIQIIEDILKGLGDINGETNTAGPVVYFFNGGIFTQTKNHNYSFFYGEDMASFHNQRNDSFYSFSLLDTAFSSAKIKNNPDGANIKSSVSGKGYNAGKPEAAKIMAVAVTNDLKHLIFSTSNSVNILDITNIHNPDKKSMVQLKEHSGNVTNIAVSPDDSLILTSGNGNEARLWNFAGEEVAVLQGHQNKVIYAGFSFSDSDIITADEMGRLFTWKLGKVDPNSLARFSPFDYHSLGLTEKKYRVSKLYDTTNFQSLLNAVLHYESSLPFSNQYPGDVNYSTSLISSVNEVEDMYEAVFRADAFKSKERHYGKSFRENYIQLVFRSPALSKSKSDLDSTEKSRLDRSSEVWIRTALEKTKEATGLIEDILGDLESIGQHFIANKDYREASKYYLKQIDLYKSLKNIYRQMSFESSLSQKYNSLAYNKLFEKDYNGAIEASKNVLAYDSNYQIAYTNLAAAYLLNRQFKEAEFIYTTYKEHLYYDFISDFEALEGEKIITSTDTELYNEVLKIKKILKDVRQDLYR